MKNPINILRHFSRDRAPRDPVTIGTMILGASATAATTVTIAGAAFALGAYVVGYIAVTAITSVVLKALSPKQSSAGQYNSASSAGLLANVMDAVAPHEYVYGKVRKGGIRTYIESTGSSNKYLHMIITVAGHEIASFDDIYINDEIVTLDGNGIVTTPKWNNKIRIKKHLGDQTTADPDLLAESNQITAAFVGNGIAYLYVRLEYDQDTFANGIPLFTATVSGRKVYDPRTTTTGYSANAALAVRDYLTSPFGLNDTAIDDLSFAASANVSDETITLAGGGTEPRYEINGVITADMTPRQVAERMMTACGGTLFWGQGAWQLHVAYYSAPVLNLTLDDLRSSISTDTRASARDNFNRVTGTFIDASAGYISSDYPALESPAFLAEDYGVENTLDLQLPMTTSAATAQRLAKMILFRAREQMTITAEFGMKAFGAQVGDIISFTNSRYGWTAKEFEVAGWKFENSQDGDLRIALTLREISEAAFSWTAEEAEIISNNTNLLKYSDVPTIGLSVSNALKIYHEKLSNVVSILTTSSSPEFIDYVQVEFKKSSETSWRDGGYGELGVFEINDLEDGAYDFRVRAINGFGIKGAYTTRLNYKVEGLSQPPQDVAGFAAEVNGDTINLSWNVVPDLDLSYYIIRHAKETSGAIWSGATTYVEKVARPSTEVSVPAKAGTYLIKSVDKTGIQSTNATAVVVTADDLIARAVVVTVNEDPSFAGVKDKVILTGGEIRLGSIALFDTISGNIDSLSGNWDALGINYAEPDGTYYFSNIIDRTVPEQGFVTINMATRRFDSTEGLLDDLVGNIDLFSGYWDDLTGNPNFNDTNVVSYVSTTNDDPAGTPTWSEWRKIRAANVYGRALRFKVELHSNAPGVSPAISQLSATGNY